MKALAVKYSIPLGMLCLCVALILNRFTFQNESFDLLIGLLFGASFSFNIRGILELRKKKYQETTR